VRLADLKGTFNTVLQEMILVQHRRRHIPERPQPRNLIIHDREFLDPKDSSAFGRA